MPSHDTGYQTCVYRGTPVSCIFWGWGVCCPRVLSILHYILLMCACSGEVCACLRKQRKVPLALPPLTLVDQPVTGVPSPIVPPASYPSSRSHSLPPLSHPSGVFLYHPFVPPSRVLLFSFSLLSFSFLSSYLSPPPPFIR